MNPQMNPIGLALCNRAVNRYVLTRILGGEYGSSTLEPLVCDAVELQLEEPQVYELATPDAEYLPFLDPGHLAKRDDFVGRAFYELSKKRAISFHSPLSAGNISSPNGKVRKQAVEYTKKAMAGAQAFGAHVFVLHPSHHAPDYWEQFKSPTVKNNMDLRAQVPQHFLESLHELADFYAKRGFSFQVGIENLEFPQYPATTAELWDILSKSNEAWRQSNPDGKIGVVLDIQHLRRSKALLEENLPYPLEFFVDGERLRALEEFVHTPICRDYGALTPNGGIPVINGIFHAHLDDIILIHLAGNNKRHDTHEPILYDIGSFEYRKEHYDRGMINIRQVLDIVHHSGYKRGVILELRSRQEEFAAKFEEEVATLENVRKYLRSLEEDTGSE